MTPEEELEDLLARRIRETEMWDKLPEIVNGNAGLLMNMREQLGVQVRETDDRIRQIEQHLGLSPSARKLI